MARCCSHLLRRERSGTSLRSSYGNLTTDNIEGTDIIEPASLVLMGIDVELNGDILIHLNIVLLDAVLAEDAEDATFGIGSGNFDDIVLRHPCVTCAC